jgi:DNA repair protein RecO (recombination protein O)
MFLSEILKSVIFEEEPNPNLFDFIENSIQHLEQTKHYANFHISFLVNLSTYLGFAPHKPVQSNEVYFNLNEGYFETTENKYSMCLENSSLFLQFLNHTLERNQLIKMNKKNRQELLNLILVYYQLQIEGFKNPKSLEVIESIFN